MNSHNLFNLLITTTKCYSKGTIQWQLYLGVAVVGLLKAFNGGSKQTVIETFKFMKNQMSVHSEPLLKCGRQFKAIVYKFKFLEWEKLSFKFKLVTYVQRKRRRRLMYKDAERKEEEKKHIEEVV